MIKSSVPPLIIVHASSNRLDMVSAKSCMLITTFGSHFVKAVFFGVRIKKNAINELSSTNLFLKHGQIHVGKITDLFA